MGVSIIILLATVYLFEIMPKGFLPTVDTGQFFAFTEAAQGISFDAMAEHQRQAAEIMWNDPYIENGISSIGMGGAGNSSGNKGRLFINFNPHSDWPSFDEVIADVS